MRATICLLLFVLTVLQNAPQSTASRVRRHLCVPDIAMPSSCQGRRSIPKEELMKNQTILPGGVKVDSEDVSYILYTRRTHGHPKELVVGDHTTFDKSTFNISSKTKILVHGYFSSGKKFEHIVYAYLTAADYNVVVVDWSALAKWCYCEYVLYRIAGVGQQVGRLLDFLVFKGVKLSDIHLIGHSLGSHVAGVASTSCSAGIVGRITGLDPARPGFTFVGQPDRLGRKCATFVDVIHTCAEVMGIEEPIGHADFYPNGGSSPQPGCEGISKELCSHSRAHYLFAESITTDVGFEAKQCDSWHRYTGDMCSTNITTRMGERIDENNATGMFFLRTGSSCPFYIRNLKGVDILAPSIVLLTLAVAVWNLSWHYS